MKTCRAFVARLLAATFLPILLAGVIVRLVALDIFDDVGDWIGGGIGAVWDAVKDAVKHLIRVAVSFLSDVINFTYRVLVDLVNWSIGLAYGLFQAVWSALSWWVGVLYDAIRAVEQFAGWLVDIAVQGLQALIGWVWDGAQWLFNNAVSLINDVTSWMIQNLWNPLAHLVSDVLTFVTRDLPQWVNGLVNNLWCFVKDIAESIAGIASGVVDAALGPFLTLLNVGLKALEWLVWMAVHPFDWFTQLLADFLHNGSEWLVGQVTGAIQKNADTVDGWLSRFFE